MNRDRLSARMDIIPNHLLLKGGTNFPSFAFSANILQITALFLAHVQFHSDIECTSEIQPFYNLKCSSFYSLLKGFSLRLALV